MFTVAHKALHHAFAFVLFGAQYHGHNASISNLRFSAHTFTRINARRSRGRDQVRHCPSKDHDRIAWEAAQNPRPSDCEGDEVCHLFLYEGEIKYLSVHPNGTHATEAVKNLTAALSDDVIRRANDKGGDQYAIEERAQLRKLFAALRLAIAKSSVAEKTELLKKLNRVPRG
jgi:hypothetical protein